MMRWIALCVLALASLAGCRTYDYMTYDGQVYRHAKAKALLTNTQVGEARLLTPDGGEFSVNDLSTEERLSRALEALSQALQAQGVRP